MIVAVACLGRYTRTWRLCRAGIIQIEKPIAEARERVVKMGSPRMVAAPVRAVAQTSSSAQTRADAAAPPKNFIGEIQNFDDTGSGFFLEYFVHRNIARAVSSSDSNRQSVRSLVGVSEKQR